MKNATHDVANQAPPLVNYNLYSSDMVLRTACAGMAESELADFGEIAGGEEAIRWGYEANENPPVLHTHDRYGNRRDEVVFHPAWHKLMSLSIHHGLHSLPWTESTGNGHSVRAALMMMAAQNETGHTCPISMTYACLPALQHAPEAAAEWTPRIVSRNYDARFLLAKEKTGVLIGMAMTEKQGGSDVRANTTTAEHLSGDEYKITGHKWFCSAPMCDAFLVLAQAPGGLTCFLLPRWRPDGTVNEFRIQRLKKKMGNWSNASSEVEFWGAWAQRIGEEGRGVATIIEMVHHTRLDCVIAAAALMRQALVQAEHHARHRWCFGKALIAQPLMQNVLADLAIESEAATTLMMRLARAFDRGEHAFARMATAAAKYWLCKRSPVQVGEALECLGGNGYVEESMMPRLYREAPLLSIWEGSGNVVCLDVLRAMRKEPESVEAFLAELRITGHHTAVETLLPKADETSARLLAERMATALQASLLARFSTAPVAEAFAATRLEGRWGRAFGTLPGAVNIPAVLSRIRAD
jgi:putative acyl-CoA dehydrogenase